ncbi:hypothetical protein [Microbacterium sp. P5_E9]
MARIARVLPGTQDVSPHKTFVDCYVQLVNDDSGEPLVHLSTFGSRDRASRPKSSQTMQFDRSTALQLARVFVHAYGVEVLGNLSSIGGDTQDVARSQ